MMVCTGSLKTANPIPECQSRCPTGWLSTKRASAGHPLPLLAEKAECLWQVVEDSKIAVRQEAANGETVRRQEGNPC